MKKILTVGILSVALIGGMALTKPFNSEPAHAGCITGAIAGGLAGHFLGHHGLAGAAAGCAGGALLKRHNDNVQRQRDLDNQYHNGPANNYPGTDRPPYNR